MIIRTVRVNATVSTVCAPPLLRRLVDLDVLDDQVARIKPLGVGVGLGVLEQAEQELGRLDGPARLGDAELFAYSPKPPVSVSHLSFSVCILARGCLASQGWGLRTLGGTASAPGIAAHRDCLRVVLDVLEVREGAAELPAVDGLCGLPGVLEADTQICHRGISTWLCHMRCTRGSYSHARARSSRTQLSRRRSEPAASSSVSD